ncbi:MAG TPA: lamin tail domain-containing protein [Candidatus Paceibacterota bacterium]|nr:lamin tail domain-containing protein [Verrucomicrobiota bacterium]HRY46571.1 lamin tail domain-containing protein [Candidatus Paceibacterota bacterium]HSA02048.1 lamin tail domain-containing protein [Candidatus Paceibacterota bacterium]
MKIHINEMMKPKLHSKNGMRRLSILDSDRLNSPIRLLIFCLVLLASPGMVAPGKAAVVINEVLAINQQSVERGNDFPDYLELYNTSETPVDLSGMSLTDDPTNRRLFVFPAGTVIPGQSYLLVWCDFDFNKAGLHSGFGLGADGDHLYLYGTDGLTVLDEVIFGLQVTDRSISRVPDGTGAWALSDPTPLDVNAAVPLGAPAYLKINEWMARPASGDDWIELYNTHAAPVALGGLVMTDKSSSYPDNRPIPALSFIDGHGYVILQATNLEKTDADHLDFKLGADGETIRLLNGSRSILIDRVAFGPQSQDVSQGRAPDGSSHFISFPAGKSTPGAPNVVALTEIVISEVLSHTDPPLEDAIELQNVTTGSVNIGYWWLSDDAVEPMKFQIPAGTTVGPGGFVVFYEKQFGEGKSGFHLDSAEGDEVYLSEGNSAGQLSGRQIAVSFGPLKNGISVGRHPTSVGTDFVPLSSRTFGVDQPESLPEFRQGRGQTNAPAQVGPVVISEIMFYPPDEAGSLNTRDEYLELHNPTASAVSLFDPAFPTNHWKLANGVVFDFPSGTTIPAGGFLLVVNFDPGQDADDLGAFRQKYNLSSEVPLVGPYGGKLSDIGETLELLMPDQPQGPDKPNAGLVPYALVERIGYRRENPWPTGTGGTGQSLQRRQAGAYGNDPANWLAAAPTPGRIYIVDSDRDGLPDGWETQNGLNPLDPSDSETDSDGDQATNLAEYGAGTNPRDPQSVFQILDLVEEAGQWHLSFHAVAGRSYAADILRVSESSWQRWITLNPATQSGPMKIVLPNPPPQGCLIRLTMP